MKKTFIVGSQKVQIDTEKDFVGSGGQADIFGRGNTLFKVYHEPKDAIQQEKIDALKLIERNNIIVPDKLIRAESGKAIGYSMKKASGEPLVRYFSNGFWQNNSFDSAKATKIVKSLIENTEFIHSKNCIIGDPNEHNFLVELGSLTPNFIDTDSYGTQSFPVTAAAPGVIDWLTGEFNRMSDWFGIAVVTFWLYIGKHPFRGNHPKHQGFEARVKAGVSLMNDEVSKVNIRDFDLIPDNYRKWYWELFENKKRLPAPDTAGDLSVARVVKKVVASGQFNIKELCEVSGNIASHYHFGGRRFINNFALYFGNESFNVSVSKGHVAVGNESINLSANDFMVIDNRLFAITSDKLIAVGASKYKDVVLSVDCTWDFMSKSTKVFRNVLISNILGKYYFYLPFVVGSDAYCSVLRAPDQLLGMKIVDAKRDGRAMIVIAYDGKEYFRLLFKFDERFLKFSYSSQKTDDVSANLTCLPKGVIVVMNDKAELELHNLEKEKHTVITSKQLSGDMILSRENDTVVFYRDNKLYSLTQTN